MPQRPEVDDWFATYENPMKAAVQRVRELILQADPRIDECIKWKSPTFTFQGNLASFFPKAKKHVSLMFHHGASIPGVHPRLEGEGDTSRHMKFADLADVESARPELEAIVRAWCDWKEAEAASRSGKKAAARKSVRETAASGTKKATAKKATAKKATAKKAASGKKTAVKKTAPR